MKIIDILENKIRNRFVEPLNRRIESQEGMIRELADVNFRTRAIFKRTQKLPINVTFVCHTPTLWSMFEAIYATMVDDVNFFVTVVTLPYKHSTLPEGQYKNDGIYEYLEDLGVAVINGYDNESGHWINPSSLNSDYIFFQTPYEIFPEPWLPCNVAMHARVCYIPYGMGLFSGVIDRIVHPPSFFKYAKLFFLENSLSRDAFCEKFINEKWFNPENVVLTGYTKAELLVAADLQEKASKQKVGNVKKILWTPRWTTSDGTCHFFDYKDYFSKFCARRQDVDFVFRPHPLCFQNFLTTGEMQPEQLKELYAQYEKTPNMTLDESTEYRETFLTSDILVSDISTMISEFFVTGKPIIYTHRINTFNPLGAKLAEGLYWVGNQVELDETLEKLLSGSDPLREKRQELSSEIFFAPEGGSGAVILQRLLRDFNE